MNCQHFNYCGLPRIDKTFCLNFCSLKQTPVVELKLYQMIKANCERLGIDRAGTNNNFLKLK